LRSGGPEVKSWEYAWEHAWELVRTLNVASEDLALVTIDNEVQGSR